MNCLVLLAGCGLGDGSCIEETVLTYTALDKYNCKYQPVADDIDMLSVNHISESQDIKRNVLVESARIGRGKIIKLDSVDTDYFDCLIIPGGIGLVNNYRNNKSVQKLVLSFVEKGKPIATMCAGIDFLRCIIENDLLKGECEMLLAKEFCCDTKRKIYYTPAFRKTSNLCDVQEGIENMIYAIKNLK